MNNELPSSQEAMIPPSASGLKFPQLERLKLTRFSLFARSPNLDIVFPDRVYCLAGANGLGKTTFLTTLNYALTGIVMDPSRELARSVEEHFHNVRDFSKEYFSGRIEEDDREAASVELRFSIGARNYRVVRGLFEPAELRELLVTESGSADGPAGSKKIVDGMTMTAGERQEKYKRLVADDIGVRSFNQFVFLQHFVLTFDESRRLLLWDQRALEQALFLAFGADYEKAQQADTLRREVERQDSLARNFNWRASDIRDQVSTLLEAVNGIDPPSTEALALGKEHEMLQDEADRCREGLATKEAEVNDAELAVMKMSSDRTAFEAEYAREFAERVRKRSRVELHPLVRSTLSTSECSLCGTEGQSIVQRVRGELEAHRCPLCKSPIQSGQEEDGIAQRLHKLDEQLEQAERSLTEAYRRRERLQAERQAAAQKLEAIESKLKEFEAANAEALNRLMQPPTGIEERVANLREVMEDYLSRKRQAVEKRNQARSELKRYQKSVQVSYATAEEQFVPLFRELAVLFLGIDLDVRLDASGTLYGGLSLAVELRSSVRRQSHQLSESQRFFLDIALRMALAQYISDQTSTAPMMVDTPEGSLDIAYESRAGKMFARFVKEGHDLFMTANINTSQLLLRLAAECGDERMKLQRMTPWAELSEVQIEEEDLFDKAYDRIEEALSKGVDVTSP